LFATCSSRKVIRLATGSSGAPHVCTWPRSRRSTSREPGRAPQVIGELRFRPTRSRLPTPAATTREPTPIGAQVADGDEHEFPHNVERSDAHRVADDLRQPTPARSDTGDHRSRYWTRTPVELDPPDCLSARQPTMRARRTSYRLGMAQKAASNGRAISRLADTGENVMRDLVALPLRMFAGVLGVFEVVLRTAADAISDADPLNERVVDLEKRVDLLETPPTGGGASAGATRKRTPRGSDTAA
jgi:hypothetical protein